MSRHEWGDAAAQPEALRGKAGTAFPRPQKKLDRNSAHHAALYAKRLESLTRCLQQRYIFADYFLGNPQMLAI